MPTNATTCLTSFRIFTPLRFGLLILPLLVAACAGAPVQEMSNARQTVMAAHQAGAAKAAPQVMAQAQKLLTEAQAALDAGDYSTALKDARRAREAALKALELSQKRGDAAVIHLVKISVFSLC